MTNLNIAFMKLRATRKKNISGNLSSPVFAVLIALTISYFAAFPGALFTHAPAYVYLCVRGWETVRVAAYCEPREQINVAAWKGEAAWEMNFNSSRN